MWHYDFDLIDLVDVDWGLGECNKACSNWLYFIFECSVINDGKFINNEFNDVYLVTTVDPIPLEAFTLQVRKSVLFILLWWVLVCVNTCFIYYRLFFIKDQFGEYHLFMLESFLFFFFLARLDFSNWYFISEFFIHVLVHAYYFVFCQIMCSFHLKVRWRVACLSFQTWILHNWLLLLSCENMNACLWFILW